MFHGRKIGDQLITTNITWPINRRLGELNLSNDCNLRCPNCQASCNIISRKEYLDLSHVKKFIKESIEINYHWDKIKCTGGEPTTHPQLMKIISELEIYHQFDPSCQIKILTNGTQQAKEFTDLLPPWVIVQSQDTVENKSWNIFESFHIAPIDLPEYQELDEKVYRQACCRTTICGGIAVGTNGKYYPCEVLYHVDRIFQLDLGLNSLKEIISKPDSYLRKHFFQNACKFCGYFKYPRDIVGKQITSPTWKKALINYKHKML